ncbi:MAG: hypothetical protein JNG84_08915 [Archangium sp.]|nr:hypothetical protein [Archangium sp.]
MASLRCGPTNIEPSPYGTSLFITTRWSSAEFTLYQLRFTGFTTAGTDAFPPAARPEVVGEALASGATVRVLLADDVAGQPLDVVVYGENQSRETVVVASATTSTIVVSQETRVTVDLVTVDEEPDAGDADAGVVDGGSSDGGRPDGGTTSCGCTSTCCLSQTTCASAANKPRLVPFLPNDGGPALVADCGVTGRACNPVCDPLRSTNCAGAGCSCGLLGPCPIGTRCNVKNDVFECVCDAYSNCPGCCDGNSCRGTNASFCGNAGLQCTACGSSSCLSGTCTGATSVCVGTRQCRSGRSCLTTDFPVCRNTTTIDSCVSCDPLRASACGTGNVGCVCGSAPPCAADQYCDRSNPATPASCKPLRP